MTRTWKSGKRRIVVVGSGIGGMAAGALFSRLGHEVHVLERHPEMIGGHARTRWIDGLGFTLGPQYVWHFNPGEIGDRFLSFLGIGPNSPFALMDGGAFETLFLGTRDRPGFFTFEVPMGIPAFRERMVERFPAERQGLGRLFDDVNAVSEASKIMLSRHLCSTAGFRQILDFASTLKIPLLSKARIARSALLPLGRLFDLHGLSAVSRRMLYGHGGIFAESESEVSAIAYLAATGNYHDGARYPIHGFEHFFGELKGAIERAGGSVQTGKKVVRLVLKRDQVTHAITEDGSSHPCDALVSDISPRLTRTLLPGSRKDPYHYAPSHSIVIACVGLGGSNPLVSAMKGRNYWWQEGSTEVNYRTPDVRARPSMLYITSHTANGFGRAETCSKDDSLLIGLPGNYEQEQRIERDGPTSVERFKERVTDHVLGILDQDICPGLRDQVRFVEIVTSMDAERDMGSERGNVYGRRLDVKNVLIPVQHEPGIENLHNVSATQNLAGIASGILTAASLVLRLTGTRI